MSSWYVTLRTRYSLVGKDAEKLTWLKRHVSYNQIYSSVQRGKMNKMDTFK